MTYPPTICLVAGLAAALITAISLPLWRAWCQRIRLTDNPGHRKIHAQPTPLAGGFAVLTGILLPLAATWVAVRLNLFDPETSRHIAQTFGLSSPGVIAILIGAGAMTFLGFLDDKLELRPVIKFTGQLLIVAAVTAADVRLGLFVANPLLNHAVTILWILTVTNAFNFMDNMNGLCAGLAAIAAMLVTGIAAAHGQFSIAALAILTSGASLGFLPSNYPRASSFLGDAGSHLLGFLLATVTIHPGIWPTTGIPLAPMVGPILLLSIPLFDLLWVVILRTRMGQPFYIGDNNHLSHRLVRRGLSRPTAVALIWILAALVGGLSVLL